MTRSLPVTVADLPHELWRVFEQRDHADRFVALGEVRMGNILGYRESGDHRQDTSEAEARAMVPGDVPTLHPDRDTGTVLSETTTPGHFHYNGASMNPAYLLCCSHVTADTAVLRQKFGRWGVRVHSPRELLQRLRRGALAAVPQHDTALYFDAFPVMYTKDLVLARDEVRRLGSRLHYGQKPPEPHYKEQEYRIALVTSGFNRTAPPFLALSIGSLASICTIVDLGE